MINDGIITLECGQQSKRGNLVRLPGHHNTLSLSRKWHIMYCGSNYFAFTLISKTFKDRTSSRFHREVSNPILTFLQEEATCKTTTATGRLRDFYRKTKRVKECYKGSNWSPIYYLYPRPCGKK